MVSEYDPMQEACLRGDRPIEERKARRYIAEGWPRLKSDEFGHDDLASAMESDRLRWAQQDEEETGGA